MSNTTNDDDATYIPDRKVQIALYSMVCSISFLSITLLFLVLGLNRKLHTKTNLLLANLGLTDWLVAIFGITINVANLSTKPIDSGIGCQITGFLVLVPFLTSSLSLALIAFHRYILIVRNSSYTLIFSNRRMAIYLILIWVFSIMMALPPIFGWGLYSYIHDRSHCMIDWRRSKSYLFFIQITAFPIPFSVMVFSYYKVFKHSYTSWKRLRASSDKHNMTKRKRELSLTITLLVVVLVYFFLYMPYAFVIYMEGLLDMEIPPKFSFTAMLLAYGNSMCDFWIYAVMSVKFRKSFFNLMKNCIHPRRRVQITPATTDSCNEANNDAIDDSSSGTQLYATPELSARRRSVMDPAAGGAFYKSVHSQSRNNSLLPTLPNVIEEQVEGTKKSKATPIVLVTNYQ